MHNMCYYKDRYICIFRGSVNVERSDFMATKSILKNVTIKGKKNCAMFANALENAYKKSSKEVVAPKPHIASSDDIKKMFSDFK